MDRLAKLAKIRIGLGVTSCLGVEQDRPDHRLHIAPDAKTIVIEYSRYTADIRRCRVARDHVLDEDLADERSDIRMEKDVVESLVHRRRGVDGDVRRRRTVSTRRDVCIVGRERRVLGPGQKRFSRQIMGIGIVDPHRIDIIDRARNDIGARGRHAAEGPPGEHLGQVVYALLIVGWYRAAALIELVRTVLVELEEAYRK